MRKGRLWKSKFDAPSEEAIQALASTVPVDASQCGSLVPVVASFLTIPKTFWLLASLDKDEEVIWRSIEPSDLELWSPHPPFVPLSQLLLRVLFQSSLWLSSGFSGFHF